MARSYFTILGISLDADTEEVKNAYRRQRSTSADISGRPGRRSRFDSLSEIEELFDRLFRDFF